MAVTIIKSTNEQVAFDPAKIATTARRAGANEALAKEISAEVAGRVRDGMRTSEIFNMVLELLDKKSPPVAARYNLAKAMFRLGPTGFEFEKYIAELFRAYGYQTQLPEILTGACITHEVDVLAKKDMRISMMECKFRNEPGIYISVKDVMSTWARFLDLVEGAELGNCPHIDECWVVTNTRFSSDALKFAHCKGVILMSWNHPEERSLAHMIDAKAVYPVTVLHRVDHQTFAALARGQVMLLKQLMDGDPKKLAVATNLPEERIKSLAHEASQIVNLT